MLTNSRTRTAVISLAIGALAALAMFMFVPFPSDTATGVKLFFAAAIGGLAASGAWSLVGLFKVIAELLQWVSGRLRPAPPPILHHQGPLPELAPARKAVVRRIVAALVEHGVIGPERPDPSLAYPGVADFDGSITADIVIGALGEAYYYFPGTDASPFLANLVMLDTKTEQDTEYLAQQIADLARIAGDGLVVGDLDIDNPWPPDGRIVPVRITMRVNDQPLTISYSGDVKYHSTHIAVAMAQALDAAATGRRLAAMWTDQGFWISAIAAGSIDTLNAALKRTPRHDDHWNWVSEWTPYAAGDRPAT